MHLKAWKVENPSMELHNEIVELRSAIIVGDIIIIPHADEDNSSEEEIKKVCNKYNTRMNMINMVI
jgi:hypothetical protein